LGKKIFRLFLYYIIETKLNFRTKIVNLQFLVVTKKNTGFG